MCLWHPLIFGFSQEDNTYMYVHQRHFQGRRRRITTLLRVNKACLRGWGKRGVETSGNNKYYSAELTMTEKDQSKKAASLGYFSLFCLLRFHHRERGPSRSRKEVATDNSSCRDVLARSMAALRRRESSYARRCVQSVRRGRRNSLVESLTFTHREQAGGESQGRRYVFGCCEYQAPFGFPYK